MKKSGNGILLVLSALMLLSAYFLRQSGALSVLFLLAGMVILAFSIRYGRNKSGPGKDQ